MLGGGDTGPKVLDSDEEVKKFVASDEGAIAFIDALNLYDPLRCHLQMVFHTLSQIIVLENSNERVNPMLNLEFRKDGYK